MARTDNRDEKRTSKFLAWMSFSLFVRKGRSASLSPLRARAAFAPGFFVGLRRFKAVRLRHTNRSF